MLADLDGEPGRALYGGGLLERGDQYDPIACGVARRGRGRRRSPHQRPEGRSPGGRFRRGRRGWGGRRRGRGCRRGRDRCAVRAFAAARCGDQERDEGPSRSVHGNGTVLTHSTDRTRHTGRSTHRFHWERLDADRQREFRPAPRVDAGDRKAEARVDSAALRCDPTLDEGHAPPLSTSLAVSDPGRKPAVRGRRGCPRYERASRDWQAGRPSNLPVLSARVGWAGTTPRPGGKR